MKFLLELMFRHRLRLVRLHRRDLQGLEHPLLPLLRQHQQDRQGLVDLEHHQLRLLQQDQRDLEDRQDLAFLNRCLWLSKLFHHRNKNLPFHRFGKSSDLSQAKKSRHAELQSFEE